MTVVRVPLTQEIRSRDGTLTKDSKTTNAVFEANGQHKRILKRPGLVAAKQVVAVTPPAYLLSQGLTSFNNNLIAVIANNLYVIDGTTYVIGSTNPMSASTTNAYFTSTFSEDNLFIHNTVNAYVLANTGVFSTVTMPTVGPYVPGAVFLDNYVFVGCSATGRIYNSALGDPLTWGALDFLTFEQTADYLVGIAKHLNYLVAFGQQTTQFYYDNANATGSPLAVASSYTMEIGCANGDSIVSTDNTTLWVGSTRTWGRSVYVMDGVSPVKVSTFDIDRILDADDMSKVSAYVYKMAGHTLYVLTLHASNITLVYDMNEKEWYQWTQYSMMSSDQPNPGTYQESYFRGAFYTENRGKAYVLNDDTALIYYFDENTYQDDGQPIYCRSVTSNLDNGSTQYKFYGRLEAVGDKTPDSVLQIRHTNNDYNTWSSYRNLDLNASRAQFYIGGSDRRRAYEFLHTSNTSLRLEAIEMDIRIGEMDQEQGQGSRR